MIKVSGFNKINNDMNCILDYDYKSFQGALWLGNVDAAND